MKRPMVKRQIFVQRRQQGAILALFAVAMLAMLALAGLGMDGGNFMLQNTRLQNTLDAAALSGAKTLAQTNGDTVRAQAEAVATFADNANNVGHNLLNNSYTSGQMSVSVEFSNNLLPFTPGTVPARYIRVRASNFLVPATLTSVLGFNEAEVASTAVAGPSPRLTRICNVAPLMACGDAGAGPPFYGYTTGVPDVLKTSTSGGGNFQVGPGNFQLVRLDGSTGGADLRRNLAGDYNACINLADDIQTEPGNSVGPVVQGINTRFGIYSGPLNGSQAQYPPDVIVKPANYGLPGNKTLEYDAATDQISYNGTPINSQADMQALGLYHYDSYLAHIASGNYDYAPSDGSTGGTGSFWRRTMAIPVGDCDGTVNGQGSVPLLTTLCFHLLQEAQQKGNESHIYGQFIGGGCGVTGNPGDVPNNEAGPFVIQLYKDPDTSAS